MYRLLAERSKGRRHDRPALRPRGRKTLLKTEAGSAIFSGMGQGRESSSGGSTPEVPAGFVNAAPFYLPNLIAGIAASVGVIVGSIGPWASVLAFTKNAIGVDGTYTLVLGIASGIALFTLLNLGRSNAGLRWLAPIAWSVSVVGLLCLLIAITDIADVLSAPTTDVFGVTMRAQVEWGLWMVAISSVALFVTATVVAVQVRKAISKPPTP